MKIKKWLCILVATAVVLCATPAAFAASEIDTTPVTALVSPQKIEVNGVATNICIYNIHGYNYFKLRDIAALVNGSGQQFSVGWDGERGVVSLTTGEPYKLLDTDLQPGGGDNKSAVVSTATVVVDGEVITLTAYNIDGYTYYQLRELCKALDIEVTWNAATSTIGIVTTKQEEENQPPAVSCEIGKQYSTESGYGVKILSAETAKVKGVNTFTFRYSLKNLTSDQYLYEETFTIGFTDGTSTNQGGIYLDGMFPGETLTKTYRLILNDKVVSYILFNDGDIFFFSSPNADDMSTHLVWYIE